MKDKEIIKAYVAFDDEASIDTKYEILLFEKNDISYKNNEIDICDISKIDILMCSSQAGTNMNYHLLKLNYYVDLIVNTVNNQLFHFQIMNDIAVQKTFKWIRNNRIIYNDYLNLMEIYDRFNDDAVKRNNYITLHFKKWAKEFNLDNPRENHLDAIESGFSDTLKDNPFFNQKLVETVDFKKIKK